ncbi:glutamate--cysteine ligase [Kibdelosporangium philippinense]|uniref:Putative glutamate--cysteine ligase 2 n=1 Tax=Kibdelosporangium philippinense TaxID=211113 RepID=A0ABS8ZXE0_9PSEU|nr:glutamate--cysteine ligase [Kibdelosporangium philippinense]MCE7010602.1 glutamate--cysteine ligase [Kibdelosporangium philippinense]
MSEAQLGTREYLLAVTEVDQLTVGVEEEFLLVDVESGGLADRAPDILSEVEGGGHDLQPEIALSQVESASAVCVTMSDLRAQLSSARRVLADEATRHGSRLIATGTPVLGRGSPSGLTPLPRYHRMTREFRALIGDLPVCGCHVHVGLPDDETRVLVCNHIRYWLPTLLAINANSPYCNGADTGYASWRYLMWSRWPSAGAPPWFESASDYYAAREQVIASGAAMDLGMLYWDVRLSAHQPTVEVRVGDVAPTVDDAVLMAALVRGIAATALATGELGPAVPQYLLRPALWRAARDGLEGQGVDLVTGELAPAADLAGALVRWIRPALEMAGDYELVDESLARLVLDGCGAARQRAAFGRTGSLDGVVEFLAAQTRSA